MAVDYDLVILGGTDEGRHAAMTAARLNARVALIEPAEILQIRAEWHRAAGLEIGRMIQQQADFNELFGPQKMFHGLERERVQAWAKVMTEKLASFRSRHELAIAGVDVLIGEPEVVSKPRLSVTVGDRLLRARAYLIATGAKPVMPKIPGLAAVEGWTAADMDLLDALKDWPQNLIVLGSDPLGLLWAQIFARLGSKVSVLVNHARILPQEDPDLAFLLQASLEAEGIAVWTGVQVQQIQQSETQIRITLGDEVLRADRLLIAAGQSPRLNAPEQATLALKTTHQGLWVDRHLRTSHPRFFACGAVLGGYALPHLARYEAELAVNNALFFPRHCPDYRSIPWAIATDPTFARIGLNAEQAQQQYGETVTVLQQPVDLLPKAQLTGQTTGHCRLVLRHNGEILGAHLLGPQAQDVIQAIALAMQQNLKMSAIAQLPQLPYTWSEILAQMAEQWHQKRDRPVWRELRETWYSFRRSRVR